MTEYQKWEKECDDLMVRKHGVGIDDIPDMDWHGWFTGDWTPEEAVKEAIDKVNTEGW